MIQLDSDFLVSVLANLLAAILFWLIHKFILERNCQQRTHTINASIKQQSIVVNQTTNNTTKDHTRTSSTSETSSDVWEQGFFGLVIIMLTCVFMIITFRVPILIPALVVLLYLPIAWLSAKNEPLEKPNQKYLLDDRTFFVISLFLTFIFSLHLFAPPAFFAFLETTTTIPLIPLSGFLKEIFNHTILALKADFQLFLSQTAPYAILQVAGLFFLFWIFAQEITSLHKNKISFFELKGKYSLVLLAVSLFCISGFAYKILHWLMSMVSSLQ